MSTIATARCTRQCASSGIAHPVFWSLPIAIHDVCSTKSAMMCLKVRSSIHATSAPTGTDEDMEGNDKANILTATDGKWHGRNWKAWAPFFSNEGKIRPLQGHL